MTKACDRFPFLAYLELMSFLKKKRTILIGKILIT